MLLAWSLFIAATAVLLLILLTVRYPARLVVVWVALVILIPKLLGGYTV